MSSEILLKPTRFINTFLRMEVRGCSLQGGNDEAGQMTLPQPTLLEMDEEQDQFSEGNYSDTQEYQSNPDSADHLTQGQLFEDNSGKMSLKRRQQRFVAKRVGRARK